MLSFACNSICDIRTSLLPIFPKSIFLWKWHQLITPQIPLPCVRNISIIQDPAINCHSHLDLIWILASKGRGSVSHFKRQVDCSSKRGKPATLRSLSLVQGPSRAGFEENMAPPSNDLSRDTPKLENLIQKMIINHQKIEDNLFSDRSQFSSTHAAALTKAKSLGFADGQSKPIPAR